MKSHNLSNSYVNFSLIGHERNEMLFISEITFYTSKVSFELIDSGRRGYLVNDPVRFEISSNFARRLIIRDSFAVSGR